MQRWTRIHDYAKDYLQTVYRYYAKHGVAYLVTYYNLDLENSVYDGNILDSGSYTITGELSGLKWRKILLLPVYNIGQITPTFLADEEGFTKKDQVSEFNFPTEYDLQPMPHDFVKFEQDPLDPEKNRYPLYQVVNFDKATNTDISFWKVSLKISYKKEDDLDDHISKLCVFFDYNKRIYEIDKGTFLYRLLEKDKNLNAIEDFYNSNASLYFLDK